MSDALCIVLFCNYVTISRPNKKHSKHVKGLRNGHFLSNGTAKDVAIKLSNSTPFCAILPKC